MRTTATISITGDAAAVAAVIAGAQQEAETTGCHSYVWSTKATPAENRPPQ